MAIGRSVAKFVHIDCACGTHLIDLYDPTWDNDKNVGLRTCRTCDRPLLIRGDDGEFYFVGERV